MRTLLKTFLLGALSIALINTGLYHLLSAFGVSAVVSFCILLSISIACLFALGCILHLTLERHRKETYRPDLCEVIQLQQNENLRVKPISIESQRAAQGSRFTREAVAEEDEDTSGLDQTGVFVADPTTGTLIAAPKSPEKGTLEKEEQEIDEVAESPSSAAEDESFSIPDILQDIHAQGFAISELLKKFRPRIEEIEAHLPRGLFADTEEINGTLVDARRILAALETRSKRLRNVIGSQDVSQLLKAKKSLREPLVIPRDAVHSLVQGSELPSIRTSDWEATLERLVSAAEDELQPLERAGESH